MKVQLNVICIEGASTERMELVRQLALGAHHSL